MSIQAYSEDQNDALQDVVNIAMGQAGNLLAQILGNFVRLSVPRIRLVTAEDVIHTITKIADSTTKTSIARQAFSNTLQGEAIVAFTQHGADNLAKLMGYDTDLDHTAKQELLLEVTNLLVGAIINSIAKTLGTDLSFSAPSLMSKQAPLDKMLATDQPLWANTLLIEVNFTVENHNFKCHLLMLMTEETINTLHSILDQFIDDL